MKAADETTTDIEALVADVADRFTEQVKQGVSPSIEEYAERHPKIAGIIRQVFPALAVLDSSTPVLQPHGIEDRSVTGQLGDFRILGEIGRGGMGVVYEAEQISIGRHVALKVLPFAALLDQQQLNRFKNEARAAGTLDHPNIVSVFSVGTERGVHYYSMQLIEGQSLAELIAALRESRGTTTGEADQGSSHEGEVAKKTPSANGVQTEPEPSPAEPLVSASADTRPDPQAVLSTIPKTDTQEYFRSAARLGVQAAQALDHAHQNGIVHRDVKPGNLLVNNKGKLWVTDFGLARIESDASYTMTGDILGTLRYMSPEQAQATRAVVDHRTDIYSLSVTLYELLTLQPAFQSENRQELLRKIAQDEPVSLSKINPSISRDLVTIVGKAMEKRPEDRYRTAQEMADDLTCFLQGRPIHAKPPTPAARVMKWSRRNVKVVWAALAASLLIAALSTGGTVLIARSSQEAHRQRQVAIDEKQEAQRNLYRANVQIAHYEWDDGRVDRTLDLLDAVSPSRGETDYRCWEWYYVKSLCLGGESVDGDLVDSVPSCPLQLVCRVNGETYTFVDRESGDVRLVVAGREELGKLRLDPAGERIACAADRDLWRQLNLWAAEHSSNVLRVYDLATRSKLWERKVTPALWNLDWSPNGGRIATVHRGGAVKIWDAADGSLAAEMKGYAHSVKPPKWSLDGQWIAAGRSIWNAASGEQALRRAIQSDAYMETSGWDPYKTLDWGPSGRRIATTNVDQLGVWDLDSDEPLLRFRAHRGRVHSVAWAPDGKTIATAGVDSLVKIWDATSGKLLNEFRGHTDPVASVRWIDNGTRLASTAYYSDTTIRASTKIWDPKTKQRYLSLPPASAITWTPSGTLVASTRNEKGWTYDFVDPDTGSVTASIEDKEAATNVVCVSIDGAGRYLASSNTNGNLQIWDIGSGELLGAIKANARETWCIAWSPDGSMLATSGDDGFKVWNVENHEKIAHLIIDDQRHPLEGFSVIWSLDGRFLVGVKMRDIRIWKTDDWREVTQIHTRDGGGNVVNGLSWNPTGDRFVSCTGLFVNVWEATSGRNLMEIKAHSADIMSVAWSPDGRRIASGGRDHLIKIWDADTGEDMLTLRGHENAVIQLSWSPDGRRLASSDGNSTRIWDATKGHLRP